MVKTPPAATVASPEIFPKIESSKLEKVTDLLVPPAPSSMINKSAWSMDAPPRAVAPSMSSADKETLFAVLMVDSLLSAIEPANIEFSTAPASIVKAPPAAMVASPLTSAKTASCKLENVIFFSVPLSENKKWSSVWWRPAPPRAS